MVPFREGVPGVDSLFCVLGGVGGLWKALMDLKALMGPYHLLHLLSGLYTQSL
jgi:hypothetical protein